MTTDAPPPTRRALRAQATGPLQIAPDAFAPPTRTAADADDHVIAVTTAGADDEGADAAAAGSLSAGPAASASPVVEKEAPVVDEGPTADEEPPAAGERPAVEEPAAPADADGSETAAPAVADAPEAAEPADAAVSETAEPAAASPAARPKAIALTWVDDRRLALPATTQDEGLAASAPVAASAAPDLLARAPRRSPWRPGVMVPTSLLLFVLVAYVATTLLWPLTAIAPQVSSAAVQTAVSPTVVPTWPAEGSAAVSVAGFGSLTSTNEISSMASITKLVTALVVLDRKPLAVGESGPEYAFTASDRTQYWRDRASGESALDVPVGGSLTELQMLEGMLIGSANNYADRLSDDLFPSNAVFANAANTWLSANGVTGVTIADPSGIVAANRATPEALLSLAAKAMANPVIAGIVGTRSIDLPGAGQVENTNPLLADPGVVGIKTGTLEGSNLLSAKDISVGGTTVRVYAVVLDQPDHAARDAASRALFAQAEQDLQLRPSVPAGTIAGQVITRWGENVDIVTASDASVVLWNGGRATSSSNFSLGDAAAAGAVVGSLTVTGPLNSTSVDLKLGADVEGPSPWWRLTHPLDILGLN